jgi:hypothetical protein
MVPRQTRSQAPTCTPPHLGSSKKTKKNTDEALTKLLSVGVEYPLYDNHQEAKASVWKPSDAEKNTKTRTTQQRAQFSFRFGIPSVIQELLMVLLRRMCLPHRLRFAFRPKKKKRRQLQMCKTPKEVKGPCAVMSFLSNLPFYSHIVLETVASVGLLFFPAEMLKAWHIVLAEPSGRMCQVG